MRDRSAPPMALAGLVEQLALACGDTAVRSKTLAAAAGLFALLRQELRVAEARLTVVQDGLVLEGRWPVPPGAAAARLVDALRRTGAGGLALREGLTAADLAELLDLLDAGPSPDPWPASGRARLIPAGEPAPAPVAGASSWSALRDLVTEAFGAVAAGGSLPLPALAAGVAELARALAGPPTAAWAELDLSRNDAPDPLGVAHATRVAALSIAAAATLTDDAELVRRIGLAALLHDVGRLFLPFELVTETPDLDCRQHPVQLEHPAAGAEFLMSHADVDALTVAVAFGHHRTPLEALPYPDCAHEHATSRCTELVAIADLFEGLTSRRPHRAALTPAHAYRLLTATGGEISAGLLRRFAEAVGLYPLGAVVELDSGVTARVLRQSRAIDAPVVGLLTPGGTVDAATVDLAEPGGRPPRILRLAKV